MVSVVYGTWMVLRISIEKENEIKYNVLYTFNNQYIIERLFLRKTHYFTHENHVMEVLSLNINRIER